MLKIKSNTNEFTIIFSEKIGKKINAENFSVPALSFFLLQRLPFFFFCFGCPFFSSAFFFFFFLPYVFKVQPFTCCSLTQPKRFSAQTFLLQFSHSFFFFFLLYSFLVQPKNITFSPKRFFFFSSTQNTFSV